MSGKTKQKEVKNFALITGTPTMVDFTQKLHESGIETATLLDGTHRLSSLGWVVPAIATHLHLFTPEKGYYQVRLPMIHLMTFIEADVACTRH